MLVDFEAKFYAFTFMVSTFLDNQSCLYVVTKAKAAVKHETVVQKQSRKISPSSYKRVLMGK